MGANKRINSTGTYRTLLLLLYLCGNATLHHTDVEMRRSSFVHLHAAVGNHKHGPIWEFDISGPQRLELYQLCLMEGRKFKGFNC